MSPNPGRGPAQQQFVPVKSWAGFGNDVVEAQAWVGFGKVNVWALVPRGHHHLVLVAALVELGGFASTCQQKATKHLWSKPTCLKTAPGDGPDRLVLLLTVPKAWYTNANVKPYKLHPKLNISLGSDATVGRVLISDTFCYKAQRQTGLTVNEWLVWKDYMLWGTCRS